MEAKSIETKDNFFTYALGVICFLHIISVEFCYEKGVFESDSDQIAILTDCSYSTYL